MTLPRWVVGNLSLALLTREVVRSGQKIDLQPQEFALFEYLMRNTGIVLTKSMVIKSVRSYNFDPQSRLVDVLVSRLKNKLDQHSDQQLIRIVRGVGYLLIAPKPHEKNCRRGDRNR